MGESGCDGCGGILLPGWLKPGLDAIGWCCPGVIIEGFGFDEGAASVPFE